MPTPVATQASAPKTLLDPVVQSDPAPQSGPATISGPGGLVSGGYDLDGLISAYEIVLSTLEEIPADLGVDAEGVEDELIEGLAEFAKWVGFDGYDPTTVRTFSISPKKDGGYYLNGLRIALTGNGVALLWGGTAIPLEGPLGMFQGDWRFRVSVSQDPQKGERHKLMISAPKFNLSFVPRLREEATYDDFNISVFADLAKVLAAPNDRKSLGELPRLAAFTIDALELLKSKADKPYGVFKITLDDGKKEACYAPPLEELDGITYPAVGLIDESGDNVTISSGEKTYVLPVPLGGRFATLAKLPDGQYRVVDAWEDQSGKFGSQTLIHAIADSGEVFKVYLTQKLVDQLSISPPPTRKEPLVLFIDGRSVDVDGRRVEIDGEIWTIDLATKEVRFNGVPKAYDKKVYVKARLVSPTRKKNKMELLAERGRAATASATAGTPSAASAKSAFN